MRRAQPIALASVVCVSLLLASCCPQPAPQQIQTHALYRVSWDADRTYVLWIRADGSVRRDTLDGMWWEWR